ncbi:hypothetical protein [Haladaptatus sp. DFWS20]
MSNDELVGLHILLKNLAQIGAIERFKRNLPHRQPMVAADHYRVWRSDAQ